MPIVEQSTVIKAPATFVMAALNDVENIPAWVTVKGAIDNVQGQGPGMTYHWRYQINKLSFSGRSQVLEQTENTLITRTFGDIESLWTITLAPAGINSTALRVVVEYTPPNTFVEVLTDFVLEQLNDPEVARQNMQRFKEMVEARAKSLEQFVAHA